MGNRNRAWVYCHIDAPEDIHGVLKGQHKLLTDYTEQMGFEVTGSSSDMGERPLWERSGFQHFIDALKRGGADVLLVASRQCLPRSSMQLAQFQAVVKSYGLKVYSPAEGQIKF